jgi:HPt (histidine-containing phosphotransfer) domain-containing protein
LQRIGHALKGALGNLSAPVASNLASQLEAIGITGETARAADILDALDPEIDRVVQALEALCLEAVK